jgi:hypothetical protein
MKLEDKKYIFVKNTDFASIYNSDWTPSETTVKYVASHDVPAIDILIGSEFIRHNDRVVLTRVEFEDKPIVFYKDVENIAATTNLKDVHFIPCDELVREITL